MYMLLVLPASPVPGIDRYGDDDLPTIPEEVVPDELPSEVHIIHRSSKYQDILLIVTHNGSPLVL